MPEIDHNAPQFHYRVSYKRDIPSAEYIHEDIYDWQQTQLVIPNQQTFQKYKIKVQALNEKGESNVTPKEVEGYSGEDSKFYKIILKDNFAYKMFNLIFRTPRRATKFDSRTINFWN